MSPDTGRNRLDALRASGEKLIAFERGRPLTRSLRFHRVTNRQLRLVYDEVCQTLHYAGSCRRVGRLMRLAAMENGRWVGGIVLGSPFPNIRVRDDAIGLTCFAVDLKHRGLFNAWATENRDYWDRLQLIANQARAFVFPDERGQAVGIRMHRLLESQGRKLWEEKYGRLAGFDTLCTASDSRLFSSNGWSCVGRTKGYSRDPSVALSSRVQAGRLPNIRDNAGLSGGGYKWWVWVRMLESIGSKPH